MIDGPQDPAAWKLEENARKQEEKARKREEKQQLRDTRLAVKEALNAETLGKVGSYRFFRDGTVTYAQKPRAQLVDTNYFDGRNRKSLGGRGLAALATGGVSLLASSNAGYIVVTVVTDQWVETLKSKDEGGLSCNPTKLYALALQAKAISEGRSTPTAAGSIPPPPAGPKMWAEDPFGRHQHRYFNGTRWTDHVSDVGEQSTDGPTYDFPTEYTGSEGVWAADPYGRYQYRFFDSTGWTRNASRHGDRFDDPAEHPPPTESLPRTSDNG